jgi:AraC-like DNA-binding protein
MQMDEGRFLLFHSRAGEVEAQFEKGKGCELCSIVYHPSFYREWRELFPKLKLIERVRRFFLPGIVIASPIGTLDAIKELFYQKIEPYLQATFTSMKIKQTLFLMLQQDKDPLHGQMATPRQKELAAAARAIVEKNIKLHYTNVQIAAMLNVERSVLTKAFRHVYDMGLHEFLIQLRFEKARELLLEGGSLQKVAAAVGYKHSTTFSSQFRKYFGYSPLDLQKGIIK